jgi:signal peptidase I
MSLPDKSALHHTSGHNPVDPAVTTFDRDEPPTSSGHSNDNKSQNARDILSIIGVLAAALVLAFGLISFVFQSYQVDGPSMQSTLETSDHLIVWKVPKTISKITHHAYIPHRADIVVFNEPNLGICGQSSDKQLIKRVIGLPGERVVYKGTDVTVYNQQNPQGFNPDKTMGYGDKLINNNASNIDVTLGNNELFLSGDHRDNSCDSRSFGPVAASDIIGKLVVRVLPLNTFKLF